MVGVNYFSTFIIYFRIVGPGSHHKIDQGLLFF